MDNNVQKPEYYPYCGMENERDECSQILPFLFLTNFRGAENQLNFDQHKIEYVVNINSEEQPIKNVTYLNIDDITDDEEMATKLQQKIQNVIEFIKKVKIMKKKVLVHCAAGISRSSTLVIAYLINCENMKLFDAFKHVRSKRGVIWPNTGFMKMLIEMEFKIYKKNTMNIQQYQEWTDFNIWDYEAAKKVNRPQNEVQNN